MDTCEKAAAHISVFLNETARNKRKVIINIDEETFFLKDPDLCYCYCRNGDLNCKFSSKESFYNPPLALKEFYEGGYILSKPTSVYPDRNKIFPDILASRKQITIFGEKGEFLKFRSY